MAGTYHMSCEYEWAWKLGVLVRVGSASLSVSSTDTLIQAGHYFACVFSAMQKFSYSCSRIYRFFSSVGLRV